jgi:type II secretory pathway predicted ATPase ExeA/septal ring-binding cell division protein DamX
MITPILPQRAHQDLFSGSLSILWTNDMYSTYLDHFGLTEEPFSNPSVPGFFFEGANRGATLDSLIYTLTHGEGQEGIIEVTGPAGSGKTRLCRLTADRLPRHMRTVYMDNLNASKEELTRSIVEALNLELADDPEGTEPPVSHLERLSRALVEKCAAGARFVLLIDEAHSAPPEVLEEVQLLYDLVSPHNKLLQIVLFGEASLDKLLALTQLHMLRSRVTRHFFLQPIIAASLNDYLMHRLRAAGYHGPNIFTPPALRVIASASSGLIERINILADKSLLAAFHDNTKNVMPQHVRSAAQHSGLGHGRDWPAPTEYIAGGSVIAVVIAGFAIGEFAKSPSDSTPDHDISESAAAYFGTPSSAPLSAPLIAATPTYDIAPGPTSAMTSPAPPISSTPPPAPPSNLAPRNMAPGDTAPSSGHNGSRATDIPTGDNLTTTAGQRRGTKSAIAGVKLADYPLLHERVDATAKMLGATDKQHFTIQLFSTENIQADRMERFLSRAQSLVSLSDLYVYPVTTGGQAKFRVAYGVYLTRRQADAAASDLPQKYQEAFNLEMYTLDEMQ